MEPDGYKKRNISYSWQQPFYWSNVRKDPVSIELERMDRLEAVVQLRNTDWVVDYCRDLWRNNKTN